MRATQSSSALTVARAILSVLIVVGALTASTAASVADSGKKIYLPGNLQPSGAKQACTKAFPPSKVTYCIGDYGDHVTAKDYKGEKVGLSERDLDLWWFGVSQRCMNQNMDTCLSSYLHWHIDKPLQTNKWSWKCDNPNSLGDMSSCFQEAVSRTLGMSLSLWMSNKLSPSVAPSTPGLSDNWVEWTVDKTVWKLQQSTKMLAAIVAVIGIVIAAVRVAITHRAQPLIEILRMFFTIAAVSGLAAVTTQIAIDWGDQFAPWVMDQASGAAGIGAFKDKWISTFAILDQLAMLLVFGPLLMIAGLVQAMFMIVRAGAIVIMVAMLPLAASSTSFEAGKVWFKKICMWLLGFVLYKPAAAIIYGAGLMMINNAGGIQTDDSTKKLVQLAAGTIVLFMAILCLPAMIKLFAPLAATGSSSVFSGAAVAGAAITGAVAIASGGASLAGAGATKAGGSAGSGGSINGAADAANSGTGAQNTSGKDGGPDGGSQTTTPAPQANSAAQTTGTEERAPGSRGSRTASGESPQPAPTRARSLPSSGAQPPASTTIANSESTIHTNSADESSGADSPPSEGSGDTGSRTAGNATSGGDAQTPANVGRRQASAATSDSSGSAPPVPSGKSGAGAWVASGTTGSAPTQRSSSNTGGHVVLVPAGPTQGSTSPARHQDTGEASAVAGAMREAIQVPEKSINDAAGGSGA